MAVTLLPLTIGPYFMNWESTLGAACRVRLADPG